MRPAAPALAPRVARAIVNVTAAVEAGPGAPETIGRSLAVRCCGAGPLCLTERLAYPQPRARICAASPASCELHFTLPTLSLSLFSTGGLERSRSRVRGWDGKRRQGKEESSKVGNKHKAIITWCITIGMLAKGTSGLGSESVSGRSRVPKPPTRINAFIPILVCSRVLCGLQNGERREIGRKSHGRASWASLYTAGVSPCVRDRPMPGAKR